MDCIGVDRVCGNGHRDWQCHRVHRQENQLPFPLDGVALQQLMGILFGGVAGIMVYISLDELLPTSRAYGKGHDSILGLVTGMVVMALSLLLMK
jgi:hypothetical protein